MGQVRLGVSACSIKVWCVAFQETSVRVCVRAEAGEMPESTITGGKSGIVLTLSHTCTVASACGGCACCIWSQSQPRVQCTQGDVFTALFEL